jgi:thioredoxin-like negative regulator of GroEL
MYYDHDPIDGARWLQVAAARSEDESNRAALEVMAARWTLKGEDRKLAASLLDAMAEQARTPRLRKLFEKRALQARNLARIEDGLDLYRQRRAAPAPSIEALVQAGVLSEIPVDPLGGSYVLNPDGRVRIQPAAVKVTR